MTRYIACLCVLLAAGMVISGCRKESAQRAPTATPAPTIEFLGEQELNRAGINSRIAAVDGIDPNSLWAAIVSNSVSLYKVTYPTRDPEGRPVEASGLMVIPKGNHSLSLISFQNGTVFDPRQAASYFPPASPLHYWIPLAAAMGNVVIVPDYLGYGATAHMAHPYQHARSLASSVKDMIIAVRGIIRERQINWNNKLFLAGYSEGGYATMAVHKLLEETVADSLQVTAVSCGAGAYDITNTARYFLRLNEQRDSFYIRTHAWTLLTYNALYPSLRRPLSAYFNPPYDTVLEQQPIPQAQLPLNPATLIRPAFREGVLNGTDQDMLAVLALNDVYDWKPRAPVLLIHAAMDRYVPVLNSVSAYNSFHSKGAAVEYRVIPFKGHEDAIPDFAVLSLLYFGRF